MKNRNVLVLIFAMVLSLSTKAGVNLKNGNFYIGYTDIVVPGAGPKLKITRTYNSKSTEIGWFGFGWGTVYETKLSVSADGCAVVREHGSGGRTRFCPKKQVDAKVAADKIIDAMRAKSKVTGANADILREKLIKNADLRHAYAKQFGVKQKIANGTVLYSNLRGMQTLEKTKDGFVRKSSDGKKEYFDAEGKLSQVETSNKEYVKFEYKNGELFKIVDSHAKQIFFEWYSNGRVKKLWYADKKGAAEFKYKGRDLVYTKDVGGNEYGYEYDKTHNLTKVVYNPSRAKGDKEDAMVMTYEPKTFFISSVKDRDGDITKYKYGADPKNPKDRYWTEVTTTGFTGKPVTNKYEYEIKTKPDGQRYTYRVQTKINNIETETIYSECCSLPLKIRRGNHVTNFEYNKDGLLIKKSSTKGELVQIEYHKKLKKITKVTNKNGWTTFDYDPKGQLVKAQDSKGKRVLLIYNSKGRITTMVDAEGKKKRKLSFKYNSAGKPTVIEMSNVGKINVAYDNYGEIQSVKSDKGHKMALQVTQAFQNLLSIVKPAGVNLNI